MTAAFPDAGMPLPKVERLRVVAEFTATNASLTELYAEVEGQPVRASAETPVTPELWTHPRRREAWPRLDQASARVRVDAANVAAFARFLPDILSPQGAVSADLAVRPGLALAGSLSLSNAATRGLLPMGPVRDAQARFRFVGRRAEIEQFSGSLAGETVSVSGHLAWPRLTAPELSVRLRGQRVPLARQPGLILRADVDLGLMTSNGVPPVLSGTVRLRDSFYLAELRSLLPGRAAPPQRRPPFFSVTEEPFADWTLDVRVEGERGLRVRTPLFRGELSPDLRLGGTLREPFAVGDVRVTEGRVQFPFASIQIEQGRVALAADNPYRPELFIAGTARAFDYDLRLHVTGFADAPVWEMSSNPPLTPEAVVLLVTAGEVPRDTVNFSDRQRAGRLMLFLGKSLFSELWLEDSAAERLTIRSGESVTRTGRETYAVEYQLTDRWSLVGEYDQFNDLNAGIKWRVYSK
jgi:translocation and assembly module TamB